jgi:hypothetical protein
VVTAVTAATIIAIVNMILFIGTDTSVSTSYARLLDLNVLTDLRTAMGIFEHFLRFAQRWLNKDE